MVDFENSYGGRCQGERHFSQLMVSKNPGI